MTSEQKPRYVSLDMQKQLASPQPKVDPITIQRFNALVHHGELTREEADKKLAAIEAQELAKRKRKGKPKRRRPKKTAQEQHEADLMKQWYAKTGETDLGTPNEWRPSKKRRSSKRRRSTAHKPKSTQ